MAGTTYSPTIDIEKSSPWQEEREINQEHLKPEPQSQAGVQKIEAVTSLWSSKILWITYIILWIIFFNKSLDGMTTASLSRFATSAFSSHSLLPILTIITSMVSAVIAFPLAKLIDNFGRAEGYAFVVLCSTLGSVLSASCDTVNAYFGARVLKTIGNTGSDYVGTVIISDMTKLITRPFYLGLTAVPYLGTSFAGPAIADRLLDVSTWRWGYGIFAITTPFVSIALLYILFRKGHEAKKFRVDTESPIPHGLWPQTKYWFWEFDTIGLIFVSAGFVLLLLAVTLAKYNGATWRSSHIIVMLIIGPLCIITFVVWEKYFSPKPLIPFKLLHDRTVLGVCMMGAASRISYYMWANYFSSYLQVVYDLNVSDAGYVDNAYSLVGCFWAPILGIILRYYPRPKRVALVAIPIHLLGAALMIRYRFKDSSIGLVTMCQVFLALGGVTLTNTEEIAIMAATDHQHIAVVLAFKAFFAYLGGAIGSAISGAVWTNNIPRLLRENLPDSAKPQAAAIFASLKTQLGYEWGSAERDAIIDAYVSVQRIQTISATCIVAVSTVFVVIWRDLNLKDRKQTAGKVL